MIMLSAQDSDVLLRGLEARPRQSISQWCADNVFFPEDYESRFKGRFNSDFTPFWNEPMDCLTDDSIREITALKCSQGGGTENLGINPIRYFVAEAPTSVLWVHSQEEMAEALMEERIKPGLQKCSEKTAAAFRAARMKGMQIYFPHMLIAVTWAASKGGTKQRPAGVVILDEVSTHSQDSIAKARKRLVTVPFAKLVKLSSPDKDQKWAKGKKKKQDGQSKRDPIFEEFEQSDQRYWFMPDPKKKDATFRFEMGWKKDGRESVHGLKWDPGAKRDDGSWDLERVRATAYYVTPEGTRIDEADRVGIMRQGKWKATNPKAPYWHRGYHINSFMLPWVTFGDLAFSYLDALARGKAALRVFVMEDLAEEWKDGIDEIPQDQIAALAVLDRDGKKYVYEAGQRFSTVEPWKTFYIGKPTKVWMTGDVQKYDLRYLLREWVKGGDSGLMEWGSITTWEEYEAKSREFRASRVLLDYGYAERRQEVLEASWHYKFIPTRGFDYRLSQPFQQATLNPFEGKTSQSQGRRIAVLHFDTDVFKTQLISRITGESRKAWRVYAEPELQYAQEVTSEFKMNDGWHVKQGMRNEAWDMEVLQILAATRFGYNSLEFAKPKSAVAAKAA